MAADPQRVAELFAEALERPPEEWRAFLDSRCGASTALRAEVDSLLAAHARSEGFLERLDGQRGAKLLSLAAGTRLGPYEVVSRVGAGGMGEVYRARDTRLDRTVALKVLPAGVADDARRLERFRQEARAVSRLSHPHICTLYDVGEQDGTFFLVMEHVEGRTLAQRLEQGPLPLEELLRYGIQMAEALQAAHRGGVVHRDLKPANVMLTREGVKLLDFGLARLNLAEEEPPAERAPLSTLTKEGEVLGTVPYMAPEQLEGKKADARTDIFALGVVLYEMATGHRPFEATSRASLIAAIMTAEPAPLTRLQPLAPPALEWTVKRCLAKDPEERWQSAADVAAQLHWTLEGGSQAGSPAPATRRRHRERWAWATAAAAVVALVVGWIARGPRSPATAPRPIRSLAVLPLENLSHDPEQDYLVDGMTEALITRLAQIGSVKVISRTSTMRYKGTSKPLPEIARELGVDAVVEGSVLRAGERVRISAQLVDASTDAHLWARDYESELKDILALHAEVASAVAGEIRAALTPSEQARLRASGTLDPEAYKAFLRGRHLHGKGTPGELQAAVTQFSQAIDRDPAYAPAHAGLAQVYRELGAGSMLPQEEAWPRVRAAARKALEIDPQLAEAYAPLAWATGCWGRDWAEAERLFGKGLALKPNDAEGHYLYSYYLRCMGRFDEAIVEARRAHELDPFSGVVHQAMGNVLYFARRYDEAIADLSEWPEEKPLVAHILLGMSFAQKGEDDKAMRELRTVRDMSGGIPELLMPLAIGHAIAGRRREALEVAHEVEGRRGVAAFMFALLYASLGDKDGAFEWLERSYRNREWFTACLRAWPELDALRADPRYQAMVERMRFPPWGQPATP